MNKLFTKIGTAMVGIAMAIGVGVAVGRDATIKKADAVVTGTTEFELVTNVSNLASGDHVLIGGLYTRTDSSYSEYHFINTVSNNGTRKTTVATVSNNKVTIGTSDIMYFTVGGTSGAWTFSTNGYAGTAGYLNATSATNSNNLKIVAALDNYAYFNISSINSTTGEADITCNGKTSRHIMYVNGSYDTSTKAHSAVVSCYASKTESNYSKPRIYKEVSTGPQVVYTPESIRIEDESLIKKTYFTGESWNNSTFNVQLVKGGNDEPKTYQYVDLTENLTFVYKNSSSETMNSPATANGVTLTITSSDYSSLPACVSSPFNVAVKTLPSTHYDLDLSTDQTDDAADDYLEWDKQYVYMIVDKADATTNANNYYPGTSGKSYTSTRFYKDSVLTISPIDGYPLIVIDFTATSESYATALGNSSWSNATAITDGTNVRVIVESSSSDVECTIGANCGFTEIDFYYEKTWAREFLDTFTCSGVTKENPDGAITAENPGTVWSTLATALDSDTDLKASLKTLAADEGGTVNQQAMARYDLVIRKYGTGTYNDFIGRFSTGGINASANLNRIGDNSDSYVLVIVIASIVATAMIAGIFFVCRRKEDK